MHGLQDSYNLSLEKTSAAIDNLHGRVTSVIYDLPIGRRKGFLGGNAATRAWLSSWQLGGIFVAQSGLALTHGVTRAVLNANS